MTDQTYNELRVQLQKHKDNERLYRDKLKEVNLTRSHINDQLELLTQNYDKKIKSLEQKLESLKQHNHTLTKQNVIFRTEIDTYQARLVEKEKIIALLLQQKKDITVVNSSERSRSDQTESLKAVEEEKNMKKQEKYQEEGQVKRR
jgi:chromosome segregation ATPase